MQNQNPFAGLDPNKPEDIIEAARIAGISDYELTQAMPELEQHINAPQLNNGKEEGFWSETVDYVQDRAGDFAGNAMKFVGRGIDEFNQASKVAPINIGGIGAPLAGLMQSDIGKQTGQALQSTGQALIDDDFGFDAQNNQYSWEQVKADPSVSTIAGYITREGLGSVPEMVAMLNPYGLAAYGASAIERIATERAQNDGRTKASTEDYSIAAPTAAAVVLMDKLGFDKAREVVQYGVKEFAKKGGLEALTEFGQESLESTATTLGTEKGFDLYSTLDAGFAGAVAGGGMGAAINAGSQAFNKLNGVEAGTPVQDIPFEQKKSDFEAKIERVRQAGIQAEQRGDSPETIQRLRDAYTTVNNQYNDFLAKNDPNYVKPTQQAQSAQEQAKEQAKAQGGDALTQEVAATTTAGTEVPKAVDEELRIQRERDRIRQENARFDAPAIARKFSLMQSDAGVIGDELLARDEQQRENRVTNASMLAPQELPREVAARVFGEDSQYRTGTDNARVKSNGTPFPTAKSVQITPKYKQAVEQGLNPEIVKVGNGYGWELNNDTERDTRSLRGNDNQQTGSVGVGLPQQGQRDDAIADTANNNGFNNGQVDTLADGRDGNDNALELQTETEVGNLRIVEAPLNELTLSKDVPQFKDGANSDGVVEQLEGKFDRTGTGPIQVWVRSDGRKEIISGRHRADLARRSGEQTIPAQYHYEANGFTQDDAASLDAILNIRDGQGKVKDYVNYFKYSNTTRQEAESEGLLARRLGQRAYTIANEGTENLISQHANDQITDEEAYRIAKAAPGNVDLQNVGIKARQEGKTIAVAENMMRALSYMSEGQMTGGTFDLFGDNDAALIEAEQLAKAAAQKQADIAKRLSAIRGAAKNPKLAAQEGIDIRDEKALNNRIQALQQEKNDWDNWHTDTTKVEQLRSELGLSTQPTDFGLMQESEQERLDRERYEQQAQLDAQQAQQAIFDQQDADAQVDDFTLTGSNQPADIAMSQGQNDLFGASQVSDAELLQRERETRINDIARGYVGKLPDDANQSREMLASDGYDERDVESILQSVFAMEMDKWRNEREQRLANTKNAQAVKVVDEQAQGNSPTFDIEVGSNNVNVYGDIEAIRAKLSENGIQFPGAEIEGGLSFGKKLQERITNALSKSETGDAEQPNAPENIQPVEVNTETQNQPTNTEASTEAFFDGEAAQEAQVDDNFAIPNAIDSAFRNGDRPKNNNDIKRILRANGINDSLEAQKEAQEFYEAVAVKEARKIAELAKDNTDHAVDKLISLYENQPNLNVRTATSKRNQAYSTPAPLSYILNKALQISDTDKVLEPTAGNGLLLITNNQDLTTVNELDTARMRQLKWLGYDPINADATGKLTAKSQDVVIMNPPFGPASEPKVFKGADGYDYKLQDIDHIIAAQQLQSMKDNGRAMLILGANKEPGKTQGGKTGTFLNYLYSNYNVVDHVELDGRVYRKQGAEWPIRIIAINGRSNTGKYAPQNGEIERISGDNERQIIGEFYERYKRNGVMDAANWQPINNPASSNDMRSWQENVVEQESDQESVAIENTPTTNGDPATIESSPSGNVGQPGIRGTSEDRPTGTVGAINDDDDTGTGRTELGNRKPLMEGAGQTSELPRDIRNERERYANDSIRRLSGASKLNDYQASYTSASRGFNQDVLIPVNMADKVQKSQRKLIERRGDIDSFVQDKLQYKDTAALHKAFMGLQIDAVAMAIDKIEQGKSIIIADQTGVGKGRQAAGVMRYAQLSGKTPIFITQKPNLFSDMYDDSMDIGNTDLKPLVINAGESIKSGGKDVVKHTRKELKSAIDTIMRDGKLPDDYNALFITYSQINKEGNKQQQIVSKLASDSVFILDESHTGAGSESKTGKFLRSVLPKSSGSLFLSATYAKRPDNLGLYNTTSLGDAANSAEELQEAIENGGLQLQTLLSSMMSEEGELVRRERSFDGIAINSVFDKENSEKHAQLFDASTDILQGIISISEMFKSDIDSIKKRLEKGGETLIGNATIGKDTNTGSFTSVVHNYVSSLTMAIKAKSAAMAAIEQHKKGVKPVIAVEQTLGTKLDSFMENNLLSNGDSVANFTFGDIFDDAIANALSVSRKLPNGQQEKFIISPSELSPRIQQAIRKLRGKIESTTELAEIPISPIDYMRKMLTDAGIRVEEITGRGRYVDYNDNMKVKRKSADESKSQRKSIVDRFNSGKTDALILNQSGATGLSIHASEKVKDKKPRHMIVAQPSLDINTFMQMLGRINRTGQVELPSYTLLWLDLPSEKRPANVLSNKMKQLNAQTSANTDSATSVESVDMFNKYGNQVVADFLTENPHYMTMMAKDFELDSPDLAKEVTGKLALLSIDKQNEFFDTVEPAYIEHIAQLKAIGEYDLETQEVDLQAEPLEQTIIEKGQNRSVFDGDVKLTKSRIKRQGKPTTVEELEEEINSVNQDEIKAQIQTAKQSAIDYVNEKVDERLLKVNLKLAMIDDKESDKYKALSDSKKDIEASRQEELNKVDKIINTMNYRVSIGSNVKILTSDQPVYGVITGFTYNHDGKGNPVSPSKFKFRVVTAGNMQNTSMSLSQLLKPDVVELNVVSKTGIRNIFNAEANKPQHEERYIVTGNLIKAFSMMKGGRVVSFTKKEGGNEIGMLMPSSFEPMRDIEAKATIKSFDDVMKYLDAEKDISMAALGVRDSDGFGFAKNFDGDLQVVIPVTKGKVSAQYLSQEFVDILGQEPTWRSGQKTVNINVSEDVARRVFDYVGKSYTLSGSQAETLNDANGVEREVVTSKDRIYYQSSTYNPLSGIDDKSSIAKADRKAVFEKEISKFLGVYEGAKSNIKIARNATEVFKDSSEITEAPGAFDPVSDTLFLFTDNIKNKTQLKKTLRHELFVHKGLGLFSQADQVKLLGHIFDTRASKEKDVVELWKTIDEQYAGESDHIKAEEFLAKLAENEIKPQSWISKQIQSLLTSFKSLLSKIGLIEKPTLSKRQMQNVIVDISEALKKKREFARQQPGSGMFYQRGYNTFSTPQFETKLQQAGDWFVRNLQDKFKPIKDIQKSITDYRGNQLDDNENTYQAEELFYGKAENDLRQVEESLIKPLVDEMAATGIEQGELDLFLMAKHAKERNDYIASINPDMPDGGSGMTNDEAQQILTQATIDGKYDQLESLANKVYAITNRRKQLAEQAGLIDEGEWDNDWQFYVPLKGIANDQEGASRPRTGKGFDIRGNESLRAMGRRSKAESPLQHAISDLAQSIIRKRKNEVGQTFLSMVEGNPNPELWQVFTDDNPDTERGMVNGEVVPDKPVDMRYRKDDYLAIKRNGTQYYVKVADKRIMNAMKNIGPSEMNAFFKVIAPVTRWMTMVNTSLNPEFTITNFSRDIQTAFFNALAEQDIADGKVKGKELAKKMVFGTKKAAQSLYRHSRGKLDPTSDEAIYIEEFLADGAKTGYFDSKDVDQIGKELSSLLDISKGNAKGNLLKARKSTAEFIENINGAIENGVRLSAYMEARKAGISRDKAASFAKNLTVNFNRKGEAGNTLNTIYMFFNAAVQGNANFLRAMATPKEGGLSSFEDMKNLKLNAAQKVAAGIVGATFGWAMLSREFGGEDDDGVPYWDKIPKGVRERNLVILKSLTGTGEGDEYYKIPLPYGYNIFANIGDAAEAAINSDFRDKGDLAGEMMLSLWASFVPFGGPVGDNAAESAMLVASPTIFKPVTEIALNKNFFGGEIYRENNPYGPEMRDSQMSMRNTGTAYKWLSSFMNDVVGDGRTYKVDGDSPWYDISPDSIEHLVEAAFGGLYRFGMRNYDTLVDIANDVPVEIENVAFARQLNGKISGYEDIQRFYEARQELKNIEAERENLKGKERIAFMDEYREKMRLKGLMSSADKQMKLLRKQRDRIEADRDMPMAEKERKLDAIREKMKAAADRFNTKWYAVN